MEPATPTTTFDIRRTLTCATLATITSLALFSVVANVATPLFTGTLLLAARAPGQEVFVGVRADPVSCAQNAVRRDDAEAWKPSLI